MRVSQVVHKLVPRLAPWALPAAVAGIAWTLWAPAAARDPNDKPAPASAERLTPASAAAADARAAGIDPTHLLVDFRDDISPKALEDNGFTEVPVSAYSAKDRLYRLSFDRADDAAAALATLSRDPNVESVDYDSLATIPPGEELQEVAAAGQSMEAECQAAAAGESFPNDACFKYQWHLKQIGAPEAWKRATGKDVVVAVIDTGVSRVADLADTRFVPGYNFIANTDDATDDHGHGTHVAGTIAQSTNNRVGVAGVAYGASIMPLKVLSARGSGSMGGIAQAIRWAADHGANVINMSLGGPFPVGTIGSAVKYAHDRGVVVVAAAGNDGRGRVSYPARYPGVIAVAATQFDDRTTFYSNWGEQIDVAAPGGNTRVDQNGDGKPDGVLQHTIVPGDTSRTDYLWFMGTSMASPHVAGVAALVMSAGVRKPDAVEAILLGTARRPKPASGAVQARQGQIDRIDDHYGAGIVDAAAAVAKARDGRSTGELGFAACLALGAGLFMRRRGLGLERRGVGFVVALLMGSCGLAFLPPLLPTAWPHAHVLAAALGGGYTDVASVALGSFGPGNPLVYSAAIPLALTVLLYGVKRLRPWLAGFGFGVAGALAFAALANTVEVRYVPDILDRAWLGVNAGMAALFAAAVLRK